MPGGLLFTTWCTALTKDCVKYLLQSTPYTPPPLPQTTSPFSPPKETINPVVKTLQSPNTQDPSRPVAETVRSGDGVVDVVWRGSSLPAGGWPDVLTGPLTSKPLALLVNRSTASASEVLAGERG